MIKVEWKGKRTRTAKIILKKEKVGAVYPVSQLLYCYNNQDCATLAEGHTHRWTDRTENPEINSHWFLTKVQKQLNVRKMGILTNGAGKTGHPQANKTKNLDLSLTPYTKSTQDLSRWNSKYKI